MFNIAEECEVIQLRKPATLSSVAATDIITMNDYHKVSFVLAVGTVTTGGGVSIRQMDAVTDTVASESRLGLDFYWEKAAGASGSHTKTSADSISSYGGITVANGDDSKVYLFEVRASELDSNNDCVALYFDDSSWNATNVEVFAICQPRYQQAQPVSALA